MKTDFFLENFNLVSQNIDSVSKLRYLIFKLAIEGNLSGESSGKWLRINLGSIATISTGHAFKSSDYVEEGVFILRVTNINSDGFVSKEKAVFFPKQKLDDFYRKYLLAENDLLVVMVGGTIGKVGNVRKEILPALLNQNMWKIKPKEDRVRNNYLFLLLKYVNEYQLKITHSTHGHLVMGEYRNQNILLPPLAEQDEIVQKVDRLMALCDELEAKQKKQAHARRQLNDAALNALLFAASHEEFEKHWQQIADNFDLLYDDLDNLLSLRQTILQLAVQGRLVPQIDSEGTAIDLQRSIEEQKNQLIKSGIIKKDKEVRSKLIIQKPFEIPLNWAWQRISDITHDWGQKKPDKTFTYIDVSSIDQKKGLISNQTQTLDVFSAPSRARKIVRKDTVIYSTVRPYLLNIAIVEKNIEPEPIASTAFAVLHPFNSINNRYLFYYLRSKPFISYVEKEMKGMAYPAINDEKMSKGLVPVPPIKEQERIVSKIDELMGLCDQLEGRILSKRKHLYDFTQSLLEV